MNSLINGMKTTVLMGAMVGLFVAAGNAMGGPEMLIPSLIFAGAMNVFAFFFSDKIAIATMRGKQVDENHPLYQMVDHLRRRADLPMPKVYICPQEAPNAFATGRSPSKSAVAVTEGALQLLDAEELEGVMAHELAHIKNRDTLTSTIAATIAGVLAFVAQWGFFLFGGRNENGNPIAILLTVILAAVGAAIVKAMISRTREFAADADGAAIAGSPNGLIGALAKLESMNRRVPMQNPNPAQNNLFIIEPFSGGSISKLFASHPPTEKRIAALRKLA